MAAHRDRDTNNDIPPHSRLFVIAGRGISDEEFRDCFSKYGEVEDVWIVKDRRTNEEKGVTYVKYSKASEAALAVEEVNGKTLGNNPKPAKVIIASNRKDGNVRDPREDEKLVRLFVVVPKKFTEEELKDEFKQFGDVEYTQIVKDRSTGDNKGFGYVKFHRAYHAALALEKCDHSFRPKFAEPKSRRSDRERDDRDLDYESRNYERYNDRYDRYDTRDTRDTRDSRSSHYGGGSKRTMYNDPSVFEDFPLVEDRLSSSRYSLSPSMGSSQVNMHSTGLGYGSQSNLGPSEMIQNYPSSNCQRLHITAPLGMTQSYLSRLFNLIPGLEYCDLNEQTGVAYARYQTSQCAAYAHDKLDGFEYPIGSRLIVRYADSQPPPDLAASALKGNSLGMGGSGTLQRAASVLEQAGINPGDVLSQGAERVRYCNLVLPLPQPLLPSNSQSAVRLFIVCQPVSIPEKILTDVFCRFGNLIDVFLLSGRNYGYAKYADMGSAQKAIDTIHGQTVAGSRMKVLEAEPPRDRRSDGRDDRDDRRDDRDDHQMEDLPNKKQRT